MPRSKDKPEAPVKIVGRMGVDPTKKFRSIEVNLEGGGKRRIYIMSAVNRKKPSKWVKIAYQEGEDWYTQKTLRNVLEKQMVAGSLQAGPESGQGQRSAAKRQATADKPPGSQIKRSSGQGFRKKGKSPRTGKARVIHVAGMNEEQFGKAAANTRVRATVGSGRTAKSWDASVGQLRKMFEHAIPPVKVEPPAGPANGGGNGGNPPKAATKSLAPPKAPKVVSETLAGAQMKEAPPTETVEGFKTKIKGAKSGKIHEAFVEGMTEKQMGTAPQAARVRVRVGEKSYQVAIKTLKGMMEGAKTGAKKGKGGFATRGAMAAAGAVAGGYAAYRANKNAKN